MPPFNILLLLMHYNSDINPAFYLIKLDDVRLDYTEPHSSLQGAPFGKVRFQEHSTVGKR